LPRRARRTVRHLRAFARTRARQTIPAKVFT
jgi:hypothetical protein